MVPATWGDTVAGGRPDAVALASVAVDVRVTQIVDQTVGAHALLRDCVLR